MALAQTPAISYQVPKKVGRPYQIMQYLCPIPPSEERWTGPAFSGEPVQAAAGFPDGTALPVQ